jgi:hypothetical protein
MNAQGSSGVEGVLAPTDDDLKGEDESPEDCGQSNMISCC